MSFRFIRFIDFNEIKLVFKRVEAKLCIFVSPFEAEEKGCAFRLVAMFYFVEIQPSFCSYLPQSAFTFSKLTIETLEQGVKYV